MIAKAPKVAMPDTAWVEVQDLPDPCGMTAEYAVPTGRKSASYSSI
jgi:hypothetical protein